MLIRCWW